MVASNTRKHIRIKDTESTVNDSNIPMLIELKLIKLHVGHHH
jgi:hypothetical protein